MTTQTPARRFRRWLVSVGLAAIIDGGFPAAAEAAGPWRAQVVDAETGQPLEDGPDDVSGGRHQSGLRRCVASP